jgi:hypothetical protein
LEHPIATLLLPLARISKSFVVNYMPNTPVGNEHVNSSSSIKKATRLSPETQVTLGGYYGEHPPKKWSHFFTKNPHALSMTRPEPRAKFRQGADGLAERVCKPEIAYASTRIRPFSLASGPAGCLRKSNSPKLEFTQVKEETKQRDKVTNTIHFRECLKQNICLFTRPCRPFTNIQIKKGLAPSNLQA